MSNEQIENQNPSGEIDDWAAAFAALANEDEKGNEDPVQVPEDAQGTDDVQHGGDEAEGSDEEGAVGGDGGLAPGADVAGIADRFEDSGSSGITQAEIDSIINEEKQSARNRAIDDIVSIMIKQGERNVNGKLGATIDDPDICRRDSNGTPTFFNPETGRPFTGENPRRQALEWIKDYNDELANRFNSMCAKRESEILQEAEPRINTLRFQSTYERLDPIRQGMLDDIISDYEVRDSDGDVIGYSCDLNRALDVVNRQIARIQGYARNQPKPPTGPAMDMKTSSGANTGMTEQPKINSLEAAMEYEQNKLLEKLKNGRN